MSRTGRFVAATVVLLVATGVLMALPNDLRKAGRTVTLELVPAALGHWTASGVAPEAVLPHDRAAHEELSRVYRNGDDTMWTSIGYYPGQGEGRRPAARDLLFPRRGWTELTESQTTIPLDESASRTLPANVVLMRTATGQVAIMYWYQIGTTAVASDHLYRAHLLYNRLVYRQADAALVRIASPVAPGADPMSVVEKQKRFVRSFYPELVKAVAG